MAEELLGIFESEWPSIESQLSDGKIEKEINSVKKQGLSCKIEVAEEEWETKPSKITRKVCFYNILNIDISCKFYFPHSFYAISHDLLSDISSLFSISPKPSMCRTCEEKRQANFNAPSYGNILILITSRPNFYMECILNPFGSC
jgi:hypothetical protein